MAKVVKAFSIDPEVARMIDSYKDGSRSKRVNQALKWYFFTDIHEVIEMKESQAQYWKDKAASNGGVKHHLAGLLRCLNPFRPRKRV